MDKEIWKYLPYRNTKHLFNNTVDYYTLCGTGTAWYADTQWLKDEKGLAERRKCKRCLKYTK